MDLNILGLTISSFKSISSIQFNEKIINFTLPNKIYINVDSQLCDTFRGI